MGRDALGHGHNAGEQGNPSHDARGRFSDGGGGGGSARAHAAGEKAVQHALLTKSGHLNAASKKAAANAGKQKWSKPHVSAGRSAPKPARPVIGMHAGRHSVHTGFTNTERGGGGGGGGSAGGGGERYTEAARASVIRKKGIDIRHGLLPGMRGPENLSQARDIGRRRPPGTRE